MKKLFSLSLFLCVVVFATAQTPFQTVNSRKSGLQASQASANNPWIGAKLSYSFDDNQDLSDNFLLNGRLLYSLSDPEAKWQFPIISNVSLSLTGDNSILDIADLLTSEKGITAGLYPYTVLKSTGSTTWVLHGAGVYRILPKADSSFQQVRILAGVEVAHALKEGGIPATVSLTPVYHFNNQSDNFLSLELTGVLPVAEGMGLLLEYVRPFNSNASPVFRAGIILHGIL